MRVALVALALACLAPLAQAVDVLPSEAHFGEREARILVRSGSGSVLVRAEPFVLAAAAAPGGEAGEFVPTPRTLPATHTWRGIDGIVEVVLRRTDPGESVDLAVQDGSRTGVWMEWPAAQRSVPAGGALLAALGFGMAASRRGR